VNDEEPAGKIKKNCSTLSAVRCEMPRPFGKNKEPLNGEKIRLSLSAGSAKTRWEDRRTAVGCTLYAEKSSWGLVG